MDRDDALFYLGIGPILAIGLGVALIPLRGVTTASNLAFAFLALTIVAGHAGGRWPAAATAVASALSLNFFLTRPYLTLTIHGRDDVIAFLGLTACGLVSAALGSGRGERLARRPQLDVLYAATRDLELSGPAASRVQQLLEATYAAFPVAALAFHDESGQRVACSGDLTKAAGIPTLAADDTAAEDAAAAALRLRGAAPLPREGMRVPLVVRHRPLGYLDVWGDGRPAGPDTRRTLRALARAVAALVAAEGASVRTGDPERGRSAWVALPRGGARE